MNGLALAGSSQLWIDVMNYCDVRPRTEDCVTLESDVAWYLLTAAAGLSAGAFWSDALFAAVSRSAAYGSVLLESLGSNAASLFASVGTAAAASSSSTGIVAAAGSTAAISSTAAASSSVLAASGVAAGGLFAASGGIMAGVSVAIGAGFIAACTAFIAAICEACIACIAAMCEAVACMVSMCLLAMCLGIVPIVIASLASVAVACSSAQGAQRSEVRAAAVDGHSPPVPPVGTPIGTPTMPSEPARSASAAQREVQGWSSSGPRQHQQWQRYPSPVLQHEQEAVPLGIPI